VWRLTIGLVGDGLGVARGLCRVLVGVVPCRIATSVPTFGRSLSEAPAAGGVPPSSSFSSPIPATGEGETLIGVLRFRVAGLRAYIGNQGRWRGPDIEGAVAMERPQRL
jgi:hypothetical protein